MARVMMITTVGYRRSFPPRQIGLMILEDFGFFLGTEQGSLGEWEGWSWEFPALCRGLDKMIFGVPCSSMFPCLIVNPQNVQTSNT